METRPKKFLFKQIIRKIFLEDWVMKLVALAITFALWFGVTGLSRPTTQRLRPIPLTLRFPNTVEVVNEPDKEISLLVSGDSRRLAQINENDLVATVDLSDVPPGNRQIPLTTGTVGISLPTGVRIDEIFPRSVTVNIEAVEEKDVPVKPVTIGELSPGFELYEEVVNPAKVRVRGPSGFIRSLEMASTEQIDLTNRLADFTERQVLVSVSNPKATVVSEALVDVTYRIGEERVERVFTVPLEEGRRRARVLLFAPRSVLDQLKASDIIIEVSKNDSGRETPRAVLRAGSDSRIQIRSVELRG